MERLCDRVSKLMKLKGYTQKELAVLTGVTEAAMSRYLKGDREPKIDVVAKMAVALNTTTDYLITGIETHTDFDEVLQVISQNVERLSDNEKYILIKTIMG